METRINTSDDENTDHVNPGLPNDDDIESLSMVSSCAEAAADHQKMIDVEYKASALLVKLAQPRFS